MYLVDGRLSYYRPVAPAALLGLMFVTACSAKQQPRNDRVSSSESSSQVPALLCPFQESDPGMRLVQWAMGCEEMRQSAPRSSAAVTIRHAGSRPSRVCVPASSLLPALDGERIFAAGDQGLYVMPLSLRTGPAPVPVAGADGWRFTRLLAFTRHARHPVILAEMVRGQGSALVYGVWHVEVRGNAATATQLSRAELPGDAPGFFARYRTPRCKRNYRDCIVVINKGSDAGKALIEIRRGGMTTERVAPPAGTTSIIDASWEAGGTDAQVLLVADPACQGRAQRGLGSREPGLD